MCHQDTLIATSVFHVAFATTLQWTNGSHTFGFNLNTQIALIIPNMRGFYQSAWRWRNTARFPILQPQATDESHAKAKSSSNLQTAPSNTFAAPTALRATFLYILSDPIQLSSGGKETGRVRTGGVHHARDRDHGVLQRAVPKRRQNLLQALQPPPRVLEGGVGLRRGELWDGGDVGHVLRLFVARVGRAWRRLRLVCWHIIPQPTDQSVASGTACRDVLACFSMPVILVEFAHPYPEHMDSYVSKARSNWQNIDGIVFGGGGG